VLNRIKSLEHRRTWVGLQRIERARAISYHSASHLGAEPLSPFDSASVDSATLSVHLSLLQFKVRDADQTAAAVFGSTKSQLDSVVIVARSVKRGAPAWHT